MEGVAMKKAKVIKKIVLVGIIVGFILASFTGPASASGEFTEMDISLQSYFAT